ncbi:hypothetical protein ACLOJK_017826 [Asimina triloba]
MRQRTLNSRNALESCTIQLHTWNPFHLQNLSKALESDLSINSNHALRSKKPCRSDRATAPNLPVDLDLSKLTLADDDRPFVPRQPRRGTLRWLDRKRRRRGSRSVSGRSSDRSGTRRCCSVGAPGGCGGGASAAYATCSDFPVLAGTDSSGELFVNGGADASWASDFSEARNLRREGVKDSGGTTDREGSGAVASSQGWGSEAPGNESGYGSEPGYRGDAEFGYGDEYDEEEDDGRLLFWGDRLGGMVLGPCFGSLLA